MNLKQIKNQIKSVSNTKPGLSLSLSSVLFVSLSLSVSLSISPLPDSKASSNYSTKKGTWFPQSNLTVLILLLKHIDQLYTHWYTHSHSSIVSIKFKLIAHIFLKDSRCMILKFETLLKKIHSDAPSLHLYNFLLNFTLLLMLMYTRVCVCLYLNFIIFFGYCICFG